MTAAAVAVGPVAYRTEDGGRTIFRPFGSIPGEPDFQCRALASQADELLIGGAKGSGKTKLIVAKPLYKVHRPLYKALILRRTYGELKQVFAESKRIYNAMSARDRPIWRAGDKQWVFPSGAIVELGHCEREAHVQNYQGREWADILYDEWGNQPDEMVTEGLLAELRCPDTSIPRQFVASANPGYAGHPVCMRRFIRPCGKRGQRIAFVRVELEDGTKEWVSRQFIPGRVTDNPVYANDRKYLARLHALPDRLRRCLLYGDWDAAAGVALDELDPGVHLVEPFTIPAHWPYVAAFDWGFDHWAVFMWGRVSDDGRIYICDTIKRRLLRDWDLAETILEMVPKDAHVGALRNIQAGHDCWDEIKARVSGIPSTYETFTKYGIHLTRARTGRVAGYRNMLRYMAWRPTDYMPERQPLVQFFDTPGNHWLVEDHLPGIITDPDDPSNVLKVDTNSETGAGGDDGYDCLRYLLASRPLSADALFDDVAFGAFDANMLRAAEDRAMRGAPLPRGRKSRNPLWGMS